MSGRLVGLVFKAGPSKRHERFVLAAIANHANEEGIAWPSISLLCEETLFKTRNVVAALAGLEEDDWIEKVREGKRKHFRLNLPKLIYGSIGEKKTGKPKPASYAKTARDLPSSNANNAHAKGAHDTQKLHKKSAKFDTHSRKIQQIPQTPYKVETSVNLHGISRRGADAIQPSAIAQRSTNSNEEIEEIEEEAALLPAPETGADTTPRNDDGLVNEILSAHPWRNLSAKHRAKVSEAVRTAIRLEIKDGTTPATQVPAFIIARIQILACAVKGAWWFRHSSSGESVARFFVEREYLLAPDELKLHWEALVKPKGARRPAGRTDGAQFVSA